jgi:uncharacterized phage-associated protein
MKTIDEILKIKAVVSYILQRMPEGVDYIHLFKMVYFAQQEHLKTYGMPLMAETFVARKHGPVPSLTYKVLRGVEGKVELTSEELKQFAATLTITQRDGHQVVSIAEGATCDEDELSVSNMKVLNKWIERCKDVQAFDLSDLSHDKAWQRAKEQTEKTGEDTKITFYDMAEAAGASKEMLHVIRERQINQKLTWI